MSWTRMWSVLSAMLLGDYFTPAPFPVFAVELMFLRLLSVNPPVLVVLGDAVLAPDAEWE